VHDQHAVAQAEHFRELRRNDNDGNPLLHKLINQFVDFIFGTDINPARRLIQD
jgi:hypothetical protein